MTSALHSNFDLDTVKARAGRVGVLMGGTSAEREISLKSGEQIYAALTTAGVDAVPLIWDDDLEQTLAQDEFDRVFNALHGRGGEDGHLQGLLELRGVPYTGSGVLGSALSMDKIRCKQVWMSAGIPTPEFEVLREDYNPEEISIKHYPVMVKPAREGSSLGIAKIDSADTLEEAIREAFTFDDLVLVEQWVSGGEYTASILNDQALPIIKLETPHEFYDYDAKYVADTTKYICPCGLDQALQKRCEDLAVQAFKAVDARGWGRVDFMLSRAGDPMLIEINTVPGMTDHSLVPMAAAAACMDFENLVLQILGTSIEGVGNDRP